MGLEDLFNNKLFLRYLSGAGSAISQGKSIAPALNQITQQNIAATNYKNLMQKLLGSENTSANSLVNKHIDIATQALGGGGNIKISPKTLDISTPMETLNNQNTTPTINLPAQNTQSAPAPVTKTTQSTQGISSIANILAGLNSSDLAGLNPATLSNAINSSSNIINVDRDTALKYRTALQDKKIPTEIQLYNFAKSQGFKGNIIDFKDSGKTTHQKDYRAAVNSGYKGSFNSWLLEMAKAGAINLGQMVNRQKATADVAAEKYFTNPRGLSKDINKYINSNDVQNKLMQYTDPRQLAIATSREKENYIKSKIAASGGIIQGARLDGRTFVWTVKWPSGSISEVRYAN